jgi:hypothetical protein
LWRREHVHSAQQQNSAGQEGCLESLIVYRDGFKKCPLRIKLPAGPDWQVGYPEAGVIWSPTLSVSFNLNRPAIIRALILQMLRHGWNPMMSSIPYDVANGFAALDLRDLHSEKRR